MTDTGLPRVDPRIEKMTKCQRLLNAKIDTFRIDHGLTWAELNLLLANELQDLAKLFVKSERDHEIDTLDPRVPL